MELDAIKVLLEAQERTLRNAMDSKITTLEGTVADLVKSLEFTQAEVVEYKGELKSLKKSESEAKTIIVGLKTKIDELEKRLNAQEDYSRRHNLRFTGIPEQPGGETWEQTSTSNTKLVEDKLQLQSPSIERAHRVGPAVSGRPRVVVVRFQKFGDREAVLRNARKLKGSGVFINEDLCAASQEIKRNQFPMLRQARQEGKIAFFRQTKLIIKERTSRDSLSAGVGGAPARRTVSASTSG